MNAATARPDLYAYLDYRAFVRDWFAWRKADNPRYSHRAFVRAAGGRSSSLLSNIVNGERNLSPSMAEGFARAMRLDDEARRFFLELVALDQADGDAARNEAWANLSAHKRFRDARQIDGDAVAFLSHWYYPAIRQLAECRGFRPDPDWIARTLRPQITRKQALTALQTLEALGLLERVDDDTSRLRDACVVTPTEVEALAACNYHRQMALRAHDAVDAFDAAERHLLGVTLSIPTDLVAQLKDELNAFQARLLDLAAQSLAPSDRVVQVNLQLVPMSEQIEEIP